MKKIIFLVIGIIFIVGCQSTKPINTKSIKSQQKIAPEIIAKHYDLQSFDSLVVSDNAKVELINGTYGLDITGIQKNNYNYPKMITNRTLYINSAINENANTLIKISAPGLKKITVANNAIVSAQDLKTSGLTITAKDNGSINLKGQFNIEKIYQYGHGKIDIDWVDTAFLVVEGSNGGPIYLGGKVNNLLAKLTKDAKLHARYLRTKKAYVFTTDQALAEVLVLNTLGAFAVDNSSIYYYKRLKDITIVTKDNGNVLYPHWVK